MTVHLQKKIEVAGHLEQKRGIYQMCLSWAITDGKRDRMSRSTGLPVKGNKKKAEAMLASLIREQENRVNAKAFGSYMLFADFMEHWLTVIKKDIRLSTYGGYQLNVNNCISPYFREKGIRLNDLTAKDIEAFYDEQLKTKKATSVHKYHTNIGKALKYAVREELLEHNVMSMVQRPKKKKYVAKYLKQSEMLQLFEAIQGHKLELAVMLGAFYGLRRAEIVGLKWSAIDFDANSISIEHTVTTATVDGRRIEIIEDMTKSEKSFRSLPLVPVFREKLLEVFAEQEENRKLYGKGYNRRDKEYILVDALGTRIKPDAISRGFPAFLDKRGLKRVRFHDLRHSCASLLIAAGVPLIKVSQWLGHSEIGITANTYGHLEFDSKQESAKAMTWINQTPMGKNLLPEASDALVLDGDTQKNNQPILTQ